MDPSSPGPFSPRVPCSQSCTCSGRGTRWHGGPHESEPPERDEVLSHTAHVPPCSPPREIPPTSLCPDQHSPIPLTRLSSRLATMEANLRSPASSDMRKMYSGAETWLDRWVRPGDRGASQGPAGPAEQGGTKASGEGGLGRVGLGRGCGSPNCWMARSALQGSSSVMWTRRRWFWTRRSAWRETPELEASEMMATSWEDEDGMSR